MLNCAVIGVGYLGRFHAQKYKMLENVNLIAVCDSNKDRCEQVAKELSVEACFDYSNLFGKVDLVSIATSTDKHYDIAKAFLEKGIHVLVEKPITVTVAEAEDLIAIAKKNNLKLQVGHLERFNAARVALEPYLKKPIFIDANRLATFKPRGTEVSVILDLMIHDIDLIQAMVKSPISHIEASGAPVLSKSVDIANARLNFENGCVANITASRVSFSPERKTRIFQANSYLTLDYQEKSFAYFEKSQGEMFPGIPDIAKKEQSFSAGDALLDQIKDFLRCIEQDNMPLVDGEAGKNALETATKISSIIDTNLKKICLI
ncbi:MAG: Gfo/Idh/MocA family oxidoreductase [Proteobacteria bacterium]|nr:Gfo/Idh/MocA family oxidoreductase [Pseudomonadota bacterium]